jgi:hypothetical protein
MALSHSEEGEQTQRVQVELELHRTGRQVKIRVESHDEHLGWYSSGSLKLPFHQLPLLEQALAEMRRCERPEEPVADIIPFPVPPRESRESGHPISPAIPMLARDAGAS